MLVVVLFCSSCSNAQNEIVIEDDTPNYIWPQEMRSDETMETELTDSVSTEYDRGIEIVYNMPENIHIYTIPETVSFAEIGQMEFFVYVSYERVNVTEPLRSDYWRKDAFIGADVNRIDVGCNIYKTINAFYMKEVKMPDGVYYGSDYKNTTNASIRRLFAERRVFDISPDGEYVICVSRNYPSSFSETDFMYELFQGEKLIDSGIDYNMLLKRIAPIWSKKELTGVYKAYYDDGIEYEVSYGDISLAHLFISGRADVVYFDHEKLYFIISNLDVLDGFFCIRYGETEAELLFLTHVGGSVSPDGKYFVIETLSPYGRGKVEDEPDGYYIRNIETAKTAFIPTGTHGADLYVHDTWVSKDGLYSLYHKLKNRKITDN